MNTSPPPYDSFQKSSRAAAQNMGIPKTRVCMPSLWTGRSRPLSIQISPRPTGLRCLGIHRPSRRIRHTSPEQANNYWLLFRLHEPISISKLEAQAGSAVRIRLRCAIHPSFFVRFRNRASGNAALAALLHISVSCSRQARERRWSDQSSCVRGHQKVLEAKIPPEDSGWTRAEA